MSGEPKEYEFYARIIQDGRITIPKDIRTKLQLKEGQTVTIQLKRSHLN